MSRAMAGLLAGLTGTAAMTVGMRALYRVLPGEDHYPLPPRELLDRTLPSRTPRRSPSRETLQQDLTLGAHFGYGALMGVLYGLLDRRPRPARGAAFGLGVWAASYLGWIPRLGLLVSASHHPVGRNLLMLAAHMIWGGSLALSAREFSRSQREIFAAGPDRDADREL